MKGAAGVLALLLLAGCAFPYPLAWKRDGASELQVKRDVYGCFKDAHKRVPPPAGEFPRVGLFVECMKSKGYKELHGN